MLASISFGTFYFFLASCVLILGVYWSVPETKGRGIKEMDKVFGGNQGRT